MAAPHSDGLHNVFHSTGCTFYLALPRADPKPPTPAQQPQQQNQISSQAHNSTTTANNPAPQPAAPEPFTLDPALDLDTWWQQQQQVPIPEAQNLPVVHEGYVPLCSTQLAAVADATTGAEDTRGGVPLEVAPGRTMGRCFREVEERPDFFLAAVMSAREIGSEIGAQDSGARLGRRIRERAMERDNDISCGGSRGSGCNVRKSERSAGVPACVSTGCMSAGGGSDQ